MNKNKNQWKTIATVKADAARVAVEINRKGSYLQAKFGRLAFEVELDKAPVEYVGSPFIPLPNSSEGMDAWGKSMHALIDELSARAKEILESAEAPAGEPFKAKPRRRARTGLRGLARLDAEKAGAESDLAQKEEDRKKKPKRSKQERAERDREIRARMKKG